MSQMNPYATEQSPDTATEEQMKELNRQNTGYAEWAHKAAVALLIVFSTASLISISNVALTRFIAQAEITHFDLIDLISIFVNFLLVLGMDIAMIAAAEKLRVLSSSHTPWAQMLLHACVIGLVCLTEGVTYLYLAWQFDRPTNIVMWFLVSLRAFGAPAIATYLSLVRPSPVTPGDVAYHTSLASGRGLIRDVARHAADPKKPMALKAKIYTASAHMTPQQLKQFDNIIEAVSEDVPEPSVSSTANTVDAVVTSTRTSTSMPRAQRPTSAHTATIHWDNIPTDGGPTVYRAMPMNDTDETIIDPIYQSANE